MSFGDFWFSRPLSDVCLICGLFFLVAGNLIVLVNCLRKHKSKDMLCNYEVFNLRSDQPRLKTVYFLLIKYLLIIGFARKGSNCFIFHCSTKIGINTILKTVCKKDALYIFGIC